MSIPLRRVAAVLLSLILLSIPVLTSATQVQYLRTDALGSESSVVVRGEVSAVRAFWNDTHSRILTETTIRVSERYKGAPPGELRVIQMGGELDGVRMTVSGALSWEQGEDVVLFLEDSIPGSYRVAGFTQGKYSVERDPRTGEEFVVQASLGGVELVGAARRTTSSRLFLRDLLREALPEFDGGE